MENPLYTGQSLLIVSMVSLLNKFINRIKYEMGIFWVTLQAIIGNIIYTHTHIAKIHMKMKNMFPLMDSELGGNISRPGHILS